MSDFKENLTYEQPKLTNYGTMKSLTLGSGGSGVDNLGQMPPDSSSNDGGTAGGGNDPSDAPADFHDGSGFPSDRGAD